MAEPLDLSVADDGYLTVIFEPAQDGGEIKIHFDIWMTNNMFVAGMVKVADDAPAEDKNAAMQATFDNDLATIRRFGAPAISYKKMAGLKSKIFELAAAETGKA